MGVSCCSGKNDVYRSFYHQESQQFFDNYTLGQMLGKGSSGQVRLAYHNVTHKKVAVKIFDKAETIKSSTFQHIISQKLILEQLSLDINFPFISHLIQCSQDRSSLYMVLQYFENGNLRKLIQTKKSFNIEQLQFITICLLLTLKFLHKKGVIHGDIKPQNILIDEKGYFCIADFSSAKYYGCQNVDLKGTKGYRAPQLTVQTFTKLHNNKSDLYSLGVVLWQLAYGMSYSQYKNSERKGSFQNEGTNDSLSQQSVNCFVEDQIFNNFIQQLLKENPIERPSISTIFSHPWLDYSPSKGKQYLRRKVNPHPFSPMNKFFQTTNKQSFLNLSRAYRDSYSGEDELYRTVLLNQKKYQQMFSQFTCKDKSPSMVKTSNHHV